MDKEQRACAGVVLYRPDPVLVARQVAGLAGVPLIAYANSSLDDTARAALTGADNLLIEGQSNEGLAFGLNSLVAAARSNDFTHILLLDQDSEPKAAMISNLMIRFMTLQAAKERVALLAPRLVPPDGECYKPLRYCWRGSPRPDGLAPVDFAATSGSLVSLTAFKEIGPFREEFFIDGIDIEWGFRAWSKGYACLVASEETMTHRWGEPEEANVPQILRQSPLRNYYYSRNSIAIAKLPHVPFRWRAKSLSVLAAQFAVLASRRKLGSLKAVCRGLRDGAQNRLGAAPAGI